MKLAIDITTLLSKVKHPAQYSFAFKQRADFLFLFGVTTYARSYRSLFRLSMFILYQAAGYSQVLCMGERSIQGLNPRWTCYDVVVIVDYTIRPPPVLAWSYSTKWSVSELDPQCFDPDLLRPDLYWKLILHVLSHPFQYGLFLISGLRWSVKSNFTVWSAG